MARNRLFRRPGAVGLIYSRLWYTKRARAPGARGDGGRAPAGGRGEASAALSHRHTPGWVGAGLGGAGSSLATPRPPKPLNGQKHLPKNPLEMVRWVSVGWCTSKCVVVMHHTWAYGAQEVSDGRVGVIYNYLHRSPLRACLAFSPPRAMFASALQKLWYIRKQ